MAGIPEIAGLSMSYLFQMDSFSDSMFIFGWVPPLVHSSFFAPGLEGDEWIHLEDL